MEVTDVSGQRSANTLKKYCMERWKDGKCDDKCIFKGLRCTLFQYLGFNGKEIEKQAVKAVSKRIKANKEVQK